MLWYREVEGLPGTDPQFIPVIKSVDMGFDNAVYFYNRTHWFKKELLCLKSSVPISDYILGKGKIVTILMKETPDGELVPLVTRDRKILEGITPILKDLTKGKQEEVNMLQGVIESQQQYYNDQLTSYYEAFERILKGYKQITPLLLKTLVQRYDLLRQFVRDDFSEHDFETLVKRALRDAELELVDRYKDDVLEVKNARVRPPPFQGPAMDEESPPTLPRPARRLSPPAPATPFEAFGQAPSEGPSASTSRPPRQPSLRSRAPPPPVDNSGIPTGDGEVSLGARRDEAEHATGSKEDIDEFLDAWQRGEIEHDMPKPKKQ